MAKISSLQRRGSIWWWRRRIPAQRGALKSRRTHLTMSLGTPVYAQARKLAAELNVVIERLWDRLPMMTSDQISQVFRQVLLRQVGKMQACVAVDMASPSFDANESIKIDLRWHWVFRWLAARGSLVNIDAEMEGVMKAAGLTDEDIEAVARLLVESRNQRMVPTPVGKLERLLAEVGADPTEGNIAQVQSAYFRAMSEAAALSAKAQKEGRVADQEHAEFIVKEAVRVKAQEWQELADAPAPKPRTEPAAAPVDLVDLGERLIAREAKDGNWDTKLQNQNRQLFVLFSRYLKEEFQLIDLCKLEQTHCAKFATFLRDEIYVNYGKSAQDHKLSIAELRSKAKIKQAEWLAGQESKNKSNRYSSAHATKLPKAKESMLGIGGDTLNRHLTGLEHLLSFARSQGHSLSTAIDLGSLRSKSRNKTRKRDKRAKLPLEMSAKLFRATPFVGRKSWNKPHESGTEVFHCGLYFGPMLLEYHGFRPNEGAGLCVDDVALDPSGIPYIHIRENEFRRIKNPQSDRLLPIHPELIRLGFIEYVEKIRSLRYRMVFPDLYSPTAQTPMAGRLYKEFRPVMRDSAKDLDLPDIYDLYAFRHSFNSRLKDEGVSPEIRADLMGHEGDTETTSTYAEASKLETVLAALKKLPIVTGHLERQPLRMLPWVEQHSLPPHSRSKGGKGRTVA